MRFRRFFIAILMLGAFAMVRGFLHPNNLNGEYGVVAVETAVAMPNVNHVVINEVLYDSVVETNRPQREWFEIYNPTASAVDLYGYVVEDNAHRMMVATHLTLNPGEYVVVCGNSTAFREDNPNFDGKLLEMVNQASTETNSPDDDGDLAPLDYTPHKHEDLYLNNDGDWIKLFFQDPGEGDFNGSSYLVDAVAWEHQPESPIFNPPSNAEVGTWNVENVQDGYSIQRAPNAQDTDDCENDFSSWPNNGVTSQNTPGSANTGGGEEETGLSTFSLTVHAHPDSYQFPSEPPIELNTSIELTYVYHGVLKTEVKTPPFQVQADEASEATLKTISTPEGYVWHEWDNYGFGRTGNTMVTIGMYGDRVAVAYFSSTQTTTTSIFTVTTTETIKNMETYTTTSTMIFTVSTYVAQTTITEFETVTTSVTSTTTVYSPTYTTTTTHTVWVLQENVCERNSPSTSSFEEIHTSSLALCLLGLSFLSSKEWIFECYREIVSYVNSGRSRKT